jgi:uncharacterized protein (DUF1810 family)
VANTDPFQLQRFVVAQDGIFEQAVSEISAGRKRSHWMWFVFPQLAGLGRSATAQYYGIRNADEALAYIEHPILGPRLRDVTEVAMGWTGKRSADDIFGSIDAMKLRSSLTLFAEIGAGEPFAKTLTAFFPGPDEQTLALLQQSR